MELKIKKDFIYIFLLVVILSVSFLINFYKFGNLLYDTGREFLVPSSVLNGKVLIKEIFLSYFPLSYQINAIIFKIFGSTLDVLRFTGVFCALLISVFIYFLARFFVSEKKSLLISLCICLGLMFNVSHLYNYVLSYSYAFIYATLFLFLSLFFALRYIKENKCLYFSFFLAGICFALKAEYIFLIIPYFVLVLHKKAKLGEILISFSLFFIPIFLSFAVLFIQGFNFSDLISYFSFINKFMSSKILANYNYITFDKNPIKWAIAQMNGILKFLFLFIPSFIILYFPLKFNKKKMFAVASFVLFFLLLIASIHIKEFNFISVFPFLPLTSIYILFYSFKNKNFSLFFLTLVQFSLLIRINFSYASAYSAFLMPVGLFVNLIFFIDVVKNNNFKKILALFMLFFSIINFLYFTIAQLLFANYPVKTTKGIIYLDNENDAVTINYLNNFLSGLNKNETVLILPDGAIFNYITGLKTNLKYYQLLPNHIETLGEDNIVAGLEKEPPDYIVTTNLDYSIYSTPLFCRDFGQKICNFTTMNYFYMGSVKKSNDLIFKIYRLKK